MELQETLDSHWVVRVKSNEIYICRPNGRNKGGNSDYDLIPKNPRLTEIQNRLAEIEAEREKLNEELEQLNK